MTTTKHTKNIKEAKIHFKISKHDYSTDCTVFISPNNKDIPNYTVTFKRKAPNHVASIALDSQSQLDLFTIFSDRQRRRGTAGERAG